MTPNEYRQKHRRCRTCEHCYDIVISGKATIGNTCAVKQKITKLNKGSFCRVYEAKEFKE